MRHARCIAADEPGSGCVVCGSLLSFVFVLFKYDKFVFMHIAEVKGNTTEKATMRDNDRGERLGVIDLILHD